MTPGELPQTVRRDAVPPSGSEVVIEADAHALAALAERMQIPAVISLSCTFTLRRGPARSVEAQGHLRAEVVLACVVTLDPFEMTIDDRFSVRFVPAGQEREELDPEEIDEIPYEDGVLAIGEAAAEQLALLLPAFPRRPDVERSEEFLLLGAAPEPDDGDAAANVTPFAALAARRKPV